MEKQNESIENSKYTSESSADEFQKIGTNISLLPNSCTMDDPIQSQNEPHSTSCMDANPLEFHQHSQRQTSLRLSQLLKIRDDTQAAHELARQAQIK